MKFLFWFYGLPALLCLLVADLPPFIALFPVLNWIFLPFGLLGQKSRGRRR